MISTEPLLRELKAITDYLDSIDPQWRAKIAPAPTGASGSMTTHHVTTPAENWVTPRDGDVNIRRDTSTQEAVLGTLEKGDMRNVLYKVMGKDGFAWFRVAEGYVRSDVVNASTERPFPAPVLEPPITPIRAALWPAPVTNYTVTNHHGDHGHRGIDYAAPMGTRVLCGPNGGHVVRVFECVDCNPNGDGPNSYNNPKYGMGYGTHIVLRVENAHLPPAVQAVIPKDAFLFCLYAHLSAVSVRPGVLPIDAYQEIGRVGSTGNSSGPHLHFECCYSEYANASWGAIIGNQVNPNLLVKA